MASKKRKLTFKERLALGNEKEDALVEILQLCGIRAKKNNETNVKDIDIELIDDGAFIDCKYCETPFYASEQFVNIKPENCITITIRHVNNYAEKEKLERKKSWVAFIVNYEEYNIYELFFVPNSYLVHLINTGVGVREDKLHFDRNTAGRSMYQFLDLIQKFREIKKKQVDGK